MQRNAKEKEINPNSTALNHNNSTIQIYQILKNIPHIDKNNALKIAFLLAFLNPVQAQEDLGKEAGIAFGCIFALCIILTLCALTKAKLLDCCLSTDNKNPELIDSDIENIKNTEEIKKTNIQENIEYSHFLSSYK